MTFVETLFTSRRNTIDAIERGAATVGGLREPAVGPTDYDRIDYPYVEVLPEASDHDGGNQWVHTVRLNVYFERDRSAEYVDLLAHVGDAVDAAIDELRCVECVGQMFPTAIEDFAGEGLDGTLLLMISVQLSIGTQVDVGE